MSEELNKDDVTKVEDVAVKKEEQHDDEPQYNEVELRAMKMGWKPKDEFADSDDYVDADEFIKRKPLFDKNAQLKSELRDVKKALREMANFQAKIREDERKKVYTELKDKKKQALVDGDADRLLEIDEEIADLRAQEIAEKNVPQVRQGPHPNFIKWVEANTWYAQDAEMRAEADLIGTAYASSNPDKDPEEVLQYVEKRIRKNFPDKFRNPNREKPSVVEGSSRSSSKPAKKSDIELTEDERRVMKTLVRNSVMTEDEYIAEIKKVRGVA